MAIEQVGAGGGFRIGDVFSRGWAVLTGNLVFFIGVTLLVYLVTILTVVVVFGLAYATGQVGSAAFGVALFISAFAVFFVIIAVNMVGEAAILYGAFQYLRGQPVRIGESLRAALSRVFPLLGLTILLGLAVSLGLILLVVPGLILITMWAVVVPICVVERLGPTASMSRSSMLTKGHRWKIFGIVVLLALLNGIGSNLVQLVLSPAGSVVSLIGGGIATAFLTAYGHCVIIMTYHDLRVAKEGVDTEQIASVFD